jgi:ankyrin repeat protein
VIIAGLFFGIIAILALTGVAFVIIAIVWWIILAVRARKRKVKGKKHKIVYFLPIIPVVLSICCFFSIAAIIAGDVAVMSLIFNIEDKNMMEDYGELAYLIIGNNLVESKELLKEGYDVNTVGNDGSTTALYIACKQKNLEAIRLLLEYGANAAYVTPDGHNMIMGLFERSLSGYIGANLDGVAFENNDKLQILQLLVENGAEVELVSEDGKTPLMYLLQSEYENQFDMVQYLVSKGANPASVSNNGWTTLMYSAFDEKILEYLMSEGADMNYISQDGWTVLSNSFYSDTYTYERQLTFWLNHGIDVNIHGEGYPTLLMELCESWQFYYYPEEKQEELDGTQMIRELVDLGADVTIQNAEGKSAVDIFDDTMNHIYEREHFEDDADMAWYKDQVKTISEMLK